MSNVIPFPKAPDSRNAGLDVRDVIEGPPSAHSVQFYEDESFLFETVATFLAAGLSAGDRLVVIATEAHHDGFLRSLDSSAVTRALRDGQLTLLDARATLAKFMVGDMPDPDLFREMLERLITKLRAGGHANARVRAYGEMVDVLWRDGNANAAIRLEELWSEACDTHGLSLLCAYLMGNFYKEGDSAGFMEVCRNHGHVSPTETFSQIDDPHARLREISLLQQRAKVLKSEIRNRKELERALREALKQRSLAEEELRDAVRREHEARERAEASDAFKEEFVAILGHDLRNPLNTILMTGQFLTMSKELPAESHKRLLGVVTSGVRMQRMIEQILDLTRDRLSGGIPVTRTPAQDLVPLVSRIIDETRAAHPKRRIDLRSEGQCLASVDVDRIEQVVSNLVGNAIAHGDPGTPITVSVARRGNVANVTVHNHGPAIEPDFIALLFDPFQRGPFKRGRKGPGRAEGLGLGLYISHQIVGAHGGKIEVASSPETGTRFDVGFPAQS